MVAIRKRHDHLVYCGSFGSLFNLCLGNVAVNSIHNVFPDGSAEQKRLLFYDADLPAQVLARIILQFHAVQQDASTSVIVETRQQIYQGGFTRTGRPEQGYRLSGQTTERDILENFVAVAFVLERDILENNGALNRTLRLNLAICQGFALLPDYFHQAFLRYQPGRSLNDQPSQVAHRPDQPDYQANIGRVRSNGDLAVDDQVGRENKPNQHLETTSDIGQRPEK